MLVLALWGSILINCFGLFCFFGSVDFLRFFYFFGLFSFFGFLYFLRLVFFYFLGNIRIKILVGLCFGLDVFLIVKLRFGLVFRLDFKLIFKLVFRLIFGLFIIFLRVIGRRKISTAVAEHRIKRIYYIVILTVCLRRFDLCLGLAVCAVIGI